MSTYSIKDGYGVVKDFKATLDAEGNLSPNHRIDALPMQHIDSFSRLRTAEPGYRFDSQLTYQIDSDLWDVKETGDGDVSHDATDRLAVLTAGATAGANTAILQSHYHAPSSPSCSQLCDIAFAMPGTVPTNGEVGCGYYDGTNGIYLKKTASGLSIGILTSTNAADQSVAQDDWNLDPLDGTGASGVTLDVTKPNHLMIQLPPLGVGRVVLGFRINGELIPVHEFLNANSLAEPYVAQASLPVRYWASTSTDATSAIIHAISSSVVSEGGQDLMSIPGRTFPAWGAVDNAASGTVLVIRCKSQLNSINQNAIVIPDGISVAVQDAGCWIEVRRNATVTAGTFEDIGTLSTVEVSYGGNAGTDPVVTAGTGTLIDRFWVPASASIRTLADTSLTGKALLCYSHLLATADNLAVLYDTGGGTTDVRATVNFKEIR